MKYGNSFLLGWACLLPFFLLLACAPKEAREKRKVYFGDLTDFIQDTVYLEKDAETAQLPAKFHYVPEAAALFALENGKLLQVPYPAFGSIRKTVLEKEGPDGIGPFSYGALFTPDFFFVLNSPKELIQLNYSGKVLKRIPFPAESNLPHSLFNTLKGQNMYFDSAKQSVVLPRVPFILKEESLRPQPWIWEADMLRDSLRPLETFTFPTVYEDFTDDVELGTFFNLYQETTGKHVISFPASDSLLRIGKEGKEWVFAASAAKLKFLRGKAVEQGDMMYFINDPESSRYGALQEDRYRSLVLRHVLVSEERQENLVRRDSRLLVFDPQLTLLAELKFDGARLSSQAFFTPTGMYVKMLQNESDDFVGYVRVNLIDLMH
ncbi:hypothetical protein A3SI_02543 [Nitritalea halalkaliphila LW7]|uniref:DUF4221 domain-containing protein n=1 Tax=Nitritalea halalkaliphila LW7 TaxID=1189621 RepID=I5C9P1_9BACT|nr:DUF4221 family protein [Nitritalea halalkaliphila]EIM78543.1 hypothetical protein A3SI_02543 [Nitritalea halalkaliphila LW7]